MDAVQERRVDDAVEKMRREMAQELRGVEKRLGDRIEAQKRQQEEVARKTKKVGDWNEVVEIVMGFILLLMLVGGVVPYTWIFIRRWWSGI